MIARSRSSLRAIVAHAHDRAINGHRSDTRMRRPTVYKPRRAPPHDWPPCCAATNGRGSDCRLRACERGTCPPLWWLGGAVQACCTQQHRNNRKKRTKSPRIETRELRQRKSVDTLPDSRPGHSSFQLITPTLVRRTSESRSIRLQ